MSKKLILTYFFAVGIALVAGAKVLPILEQLSMVQLVLLVLAVFRLARMVSFDTVMEWLRQPFAKTVPDVSGAGMTTEAVGKGWRRILGELLVCPICVGTWLVLALEMHLVVARDLALVSIYTFGVMGAAELLQGAFEFVQWSGELARYKAGTEVLEAKIYRGARRRAAMWQSGGASSPTGYTIVGGDGHDQENQA